MQLRQGANWGRLVGMPELNKLDWHLAIRTGPSLAWSFTSNIYITDGLFISIKLLMVNVDMFNGKTNHCTSVCPLRIITTHSMDYLLHHELFIPLYSVYKYYSQHVCRHLQTPRKFLSEAIENRFSIHPKWPFHLPQNQNSMVQPHTNRSPTHSQPRKPDTKTLLMTKNHMASLQESSLMKNQEWNNSKVPLMSINEIFLFFHSQFGLGRIFSPDCSHKKTVSNAGQTDYIRALTASFFNSSCARSRRGAHFF